MQLYPQLACTTSDVAKQLNSQMSCVMLWVAHVVVLPNPCAPQVLLLFLMTADMSSWGSNSSGTQQVRLGQQQAQVQAQEVRDKVRPFGNW